MLSIEQKCNKEQWYCQQIPSSFMQNKRIALSFFSDFSEFL